MKEWKAPKLSNLNVSQTMNTEELSDPKAYSWQCECDGCDQLISCGKSEDILHV